jgi:UTP--glucose-1-phosphate uridylyltransferase
MATRFGGVPKGVVSVVSGEPESFLALKLHQARDVDGAEGAIVPVVLMHSFATRDASCAHLEAIDWSGLPSEQCLSFDQSFLPRITPEGVWVGELEGAERLLDTRVYAAPGHGDTLRMILASGVWARLSERGVRHLLVSNVDNLGASVDLEIFARHLDAVADGAEVSVEVVSRRAGDAGGCVAAVGDRAQIIEGFRLPEGTELSNYPHFNTNTLWFSLPALERPLPLSWFPVRREIEVADGRKMRIVQFEQLIGQATEFLRTGVIEVRREERFLPIKSREDLAAAESAMYRRIERARNYAEPAI